MNSNTTIHNHRYTYSHKTGQLFLRGFMSFLVIMLGIQLSYGQMLTAPPTYTGADGKVVQLDVNHDEIFVAFHSSIDLNQANNFSNNYTFLSSPTERSLFTPMKGVVYDFNGSAQELEAKLEILRNDPQVASAYPLYEIDGDKVYVHSDLMVKPNRNYPAIELTSYLASNGMTVKNTFRMGQGEEMWVVQVPATEDLWRIGQELQVHPKVAFAHPDFISTGAHELIPNDTDFGLQWFLNQVSDADIDAPEAWDCTTGNPNVIVSVIDGNGYDMTHPEFAGQLFMPYDAVNNDNDPSPENSSANHGTPCAGLVAGLTNNALGVASVGWNIRVKPVVIGFNASGNSFFSSSAIIVAAANNVIATAGIVAVSNSYSLGSGLANNASVQTAFSNMNTNCRGGLGAVVLASSGNNSSGTSIGSPARYTSTLAVGASNQTDFRAGFSNFGLDGNGLDLVAPGVSTRTLDRQGAPGYNGTDYTNFTGTSAACPVAAGVVGLIASANAGLTEAQLEQALAATCDKVNPGTYTYGAQAGKPHGTWNNQMGYGRVNAFGAVKFFATADAVCQNHTVFLDASGNATITTADIDGGSTGTLSLSQSSFDCDDLGANTVTLYATDGGSVDSCTATVTVIDNIPPTLTCPADTTVSTDPGLCEAEVEVIVDVTDNCSSFTLDTAQSPVTAYTVVPGGAGNTILNIPVALAAAVNGTLVIRHRGDINSSFERFTVQGEDGSNLGQTNNGSQCGGYATTTIALTGAQIAAWGADGTVSITLLQNTSIDLFCTNNDAFALLYYTSSDIVVTNSYTANGADASGIYPVGTTTVTFTATDASGNTASCSVDITVEDTEAPEALCLGGVGGGTPLVAYLTMQSNPPWCEPFCGTGGDNPALLDDVFGAGNWDSYDFGTVNVATLFSANYNTIIMDGSDGAANAMETFLTANQAAMENWVAAGNVLFLNSAPNQGNGMSFGFGGVQLTYPSFNGNANAVLAAHPIFNGPATPVGLSWTGNFFGHAIVCPAALTATVLIEGAGGNDLLVDANWGSGKVLFGGMTLPHFHNPKPHTLNLRRNIFSYMAASIISGPLEFELDANGELLLTPADIDNGSSDNCGIESMTVIPDMFDCDDIGSHVVQLIVVDSAGNADTCTAQIEVADEMPPVITCPADVTIECDEDQTPASLGTATATDNCSDPSDIFITFNDAITPGNCPGNYTIHRTWTAIDEAGNWSTCVQTITVEDTQAPVPPAAPADVTVECMADVPAPAFLMAQDNCEGMIVGISADSITPGLCPNEKTITRTWLFKDGCNNSVTVSQTIVVDDNTAPDAPDLPDLSFQCADDVPAPPAVVTALDNCDGVIVGVFNEVTTPGSCVNNFVVTRTWIFVDACGNQSSEVQTITVNDDTDPEASCPPDVSGLQCGDTPPAAATTIADFLALGGVVGDNCTATGDISISSSDSDNGNTECVSDGIRVITRTYTFTDECGNSTSCDQTFTYDEDTSAPDITCPADESDLDCNYVVPAGATDIASFLALGGTASDNCTATADLSVSYVDNDNMTLSCPGDARVIVRTYTITDACGNSATCDQTFTYEEITTPPVINCPPDLVCLCGNPNNPLLISNWLSSVTASSDCPLSVSITNDYPNGIFTPDCGNAGTQEVTFTATDQCGNVSECTATITFVDNNPPELDCPAPLTVGTDGGLGAGGFCQDNPDPVVAVIGTYLFADDVANDLIAAGYNATHYSSVPSAATLAGIDVVMLIRAFGNTDLENWVQAGGLLVTEWTATDWAINTAGLLQGNVFHVGFLGTGTPVKFEATPEGMALGAGMDNPYSDTERTQFFRGFSGLGAGTSVIATRPGNQPAIVGGESGSGYVLAIGYCWSDRFNSQPNAQTDLLMDNAIAYCLGTDGCVATIGPGVVAIDAFDKCDPNFTVTNDSPHADDNNSADAAGVYPKGVYDITFTATDACGNVSSCVVSLTVEDDDPAVISCPDDIVVDADPGECGAIVSFNLPEFADNCPDPILTQVSGLGSGDFFPTGTTVQEYMVIDCGGNVSMCSFSVTVNNTLKSKCTTYSYAPGTPSDHALLLNNLPFGLNSRFLWVGGQGTLDVFLDGTARLSGQVVNVSDANAIFDVDMNFENEMSWAMWSALGRNYKANAVNQAVADANHMDWTFWELGTATITGAAGSTYDGDVISMTHKPADYSYGFQLGLGANDKDTDYGFSGWFYYSGTLGGQNASGDGDVNNDASCQENPCGVSIAVAPRMMLEGPFNAATMKMNDDLRVAGYIPLSEPYTSYGFPHAGNGGGESMDQTVLQQTGDDAIVDWVVVSLRNINDIETILATKSALLQADGDIVDVDGVSPVSFEGVAAGQYHVGIHHENHLWVVSNYTYNLSASAEYLDFSDGSVLAFGEDGMEELAGLIKAMTAFDLNGDGAITAIDRSLAWNKRNQVGDHREDGDLDGSVNAADRSGVWNNRNKLTEDPAQF